MGMRTRKHAMVLLLPTSDRQHAHRHVAAMQRAVHEYVAMAQRMQPPHENAHEATRGGGSKGGGATDTDVSAVEATRLLLSLNVLLPVGNGDDVEMARAVTISGQANQVPRQIAQMLEVQIKKWRRLYARPRGGYPAKQASEEDAVSRCSAFMRLLDDLAAQQFAVSVLSSADALPFGGPGSGNERLTQTLQKQVRTQFVMLRDEDEQTDIASQNVLELLRGIKTCANRNCAIRQVEECEIEMQGVVKEWLHAAAPMICATMQLGDDQNSGQALELEIRANFVLVQATEIPGSSWMALCGALNKLRLLHFVRLKSVHPAVLLGCPLRATPATDNLARGRALSRYLRDEGCGGLVVCKMKNGVRDFYLIVGSPGGDDGELLMHRVASAEEILLPEPGCDEASNESESQIDARELEHFRKVAIEDFNAFRNRSGILDLVATDAKEPTPAHNARARALLPNPRAHTGSPLASAHGAQSRGPAAAKKKRRL